MSKLLDVGRLLPYMHDVGHCKRSLHELNLMWRMIEASAKMNCAAEARSILPTIAATRQGFGELEGELVASLAHEKMSNAMAELNTKAHYVIEIVVRNLYERTADVGFLATDAGICEFVAGLSGNPGAMRSRLRAYSRKYTVYDEIMLLDTEGNVLVQIDESAPVEGSRDPLIAQTLATDGYVETFRASDLRPDKRSALIYSRRIHHPRTGAVVGLLCLCFSFEEEMARIFGTHRDRLQRSNMLLLDGAGQVIASADPVWIPVGAQVPTNPGGSPEAMMYAGREYLVRTFASPGYQGYPGPQGWQGQVMIPLDVAFHGASTAVLAGLDQTWADGLLSHARDFCPPLFEIMNAANMIRRVVWNGQVMSAGQEGDFLRLQAILEQISETGARSNALFLESIRDLFETVLSSGLRNSEFVSHLLVDLADRNLYERVADCRWWALSPALRALTAGADPDKAARMERILAHINSLYTVYSTIVVYDAQGRILASSRGHAADTIDDAALARVMALRSDQEYHVSPFEASPLYGGRPTYIYHAAIRDPDDDAKIVGGIGIVFDAAVELLAMLQGVLGDSDAGGMQAYFVDRDGKVLCSTDASRPVGSVLALDPAMLALEGGDSRSGFMAHDGQYAIAGATASHGYREFTGAGVVAVVIETLGALRNGVPRLRQSAALPGGMSMTASGAEFATFYVDTGQFAIAATDVQEAQCASKIRPVTMGSGAACVGVIALDAAEDLCWVYDLGVLLHGRPTPVTQRSQVIVARNEGKTVGLLVDDLDVVAKFDDAQITPVPLFHADQAALVKQVVNPGSGGGLIQIIDAAQVFASV
ncbi:chemotaxis protein CheW [Duganella sp. FT92W]|uniref:Chemotaxis protein CheW n=1 Tax=Pseudoduganella rivuli TaxID=2666085 RepID=A0A7X2IP95_9BURK|nr:chemotaxis protein CheW [Pseudoduganella rivuli]MRV73581.1 chemotaxis protein CheW [Pseudoduganella rivuli]